MNITQFLLRMAVLLRCGTLATQTAYLRSTATGSCLQSSPCGTWQDAFDALSDSQPGTIYLLSDFVGIGNVSRSTPADVLLPSQPNFVNLFLIAGFGQPKQVLLPHSRQRFVRARVCVFTVRF